MEVGLDLNSIGFHWILKKIEVIETHLDCVDVVFVDEFVSGFL